MIYEKIVCYIYFYIIGVIYMEWYEKICDLCINNVEFIKKLCLYRVKIVIGIGDWDKFNKKLKRKKVKC